MNNNSSTHIVRRKSESSFLSLPFYHNRFPQNKDGAVTGALGPLVALLSVVTDRQQCQIKVTTKKVNSLYIFFTLSLSLYLSLSVSFSLCVYLSISHSLFFSLYIHIHTSLNTFSRNKFLNSFLQTLFFVFQGAAAMAIMQITSTDEGKRQVHTHACICTYIRTYVHTYIHTYIHTNI